MANPATVQDVVNRFRPLSPQEEINAEAFLGDAWWMIQGRRPAIEADIAAGRIQAGNVIRVVAHMVRRILINPEALLEDQIDDYRRRRDQLVSTGQLHITPDELADLTPAPIAGVRRSIPLVAYGER